MGDSGSLFIGFIVASSGLMTNAKSPTTVAAMIPILTLGLPILDTSLATFRRLLKGMSPFSSDQEHIHHKLLKLGLTHRSTVLVLWGFCLAACVTALSIVYSREKTAMWVLSLFILAAFLLVQWLGYLSPTSWKIDFTKGRQRTRRLLKNRQVIADLFVEFNAASSLEEVFELLENVHVLHTYSQVRLELYSDPVMPGKMRKIGKTFFWSRASRGGAEEVLSIEVCFDLVSFGNIYGRICYHYADGRIRIEPEDELFFEKLHPTLSRAVARIRGNRKRLFISPQGGM